MKEEGNSKGILVWSFGLASLIFSVAQPVFGIIFGIVGLVMVKKSRKQDSWTKAGKVLSLIGLILGIVLVLVGILALNYLTSNADVLAQLQGGY